jgi:hypothetical protein
VVSVLAILAVCAIQAGGLSIPLLRGIVAHESAGQTNVYSAGEGLRSFPTAAAAAAAAAVDYQAGKPVRLGLAGVPPKAFIRDDRTPVATDFDQCDNLTAAVAHLRRIRFECPQAEAGDAAYCMAGRYGGADGTAPNDAYADAVMGQMLLSEAPVGADPRVLFIGPATANVQENSPFITSRMTSHRSEIFAAPIAPGSELLPRR